MGIGLIPRSKVVDFIERFHSYLELPVALSIAGACFWAVDLLWTKTVQSPRWTSLLCTAGLAISATVCFVMYFVMRSYTVKLQNMDVAEHGMHDSDESESEMS